MKKTSAKITLAALAALSSVTGMVQDSSAAIVINEIYGGGGLTASGTLPASTYNQDFVELFNNGTSAVDVSGYVVRYGSATGTGSLANAGSAMATLASGISIPAGGFFLIGGATGAAGLALPTADATSTTNLGSVTGKVGLYSSTATDGSNIVDFVGFGSSANVYEGTATATVATGGTLSYNRTLGLDTNNNANDFVGLAPTPTAAAVPEPATVGLVATAGALLVARRRKSR